MGEVWTARLTYAAPDGLNITRAGNDSDGLFFAPSWDILGVAVRKHDRLTPERFEAYFFATYAEQYRLEMRASYRQWPKAWAELRARSEVTLLCYCTDPRLCHRTLLAGFLGRLGASVKGERSAALQARRARPK